VVQKVHGGITDRGLTKLGGGIGKGIAWTGISISWAWVFCTFLKQNSNIMLEELVTISAVGYFVSLLLAAMFI
jgi:hypothetical protein